MSSVISRQCKGRKLAEESQLLAEERFIVDAIKKIRTQRNCLQIERLQLESMLAEQKHGPLKKTLQIQQIVENNTKEPGTTGTSTLPMSERFEFVDVDPVKTSSVKIMNEELCNIEELNLTVFEPIAVNASTSRYAEEEEEEEYSSCDENMIIDMNMFMTN